MVLGLLLSGNAYSHKSSEIHKPIVCIPESERTEAQRQNDKFLIYMHRLSKRDQDCLILRLEELEELNETDRTWGLEHEIINLRERLQALEEKINKLEEENKELKDKLNQ